ncbi:MAG TPA: efflux RND transporter periplasmic adaptor subunit [Tepidisphaeraceae bacterium]|jgi:multidrug efflux pump subunit AcrA (membrane-fusion protein)
MKPWLNRSVFGGFVALLVLTWLLYFHNAAVAAKLPKWGWLQKSVARLGQSMPPVAAEDEDPDNAKNQIPVHTAHVSTATLHRYVEGFGIVAPRPPQPGEMAGSANLASPVPGVVAQVLVRVGQQVKKGEPVIQLDDRLATSAEEQAAASLAQAQASLAALKATPRPDQLQIAQLAVDKARTTVQLDQKTYDRLKQLAAEQGTSGKSVEQALADLTGAKDDLAVAERQLTILKNSPTPEDLRQEQAKVDQASAALATARMQRQMTTIRSPIDATVVSVSVNPGESVDVTKTLLQLVAVDRLVVDVDVPADQLPAKTDGLPAQILVGSGAAASDGSSEPLLGKVAFVSPQVDPRSGAVQVDIELPADAKLRPGLSVRVRIIADEHKDVLAVPREAVVTDENGDSTIALVDGEQATRKVVKAGLEENGLIEITADGVKEGDTVVTAGAFGLPQASHVKVLD